MEDNGEGQWIGNALGMRWWKVISIIVMDRKSRWRVGRVMERKSTRRPNESPYPKQICLDHV